ncbi:MAG TPA: hypothetical protein VM053_04575 [Gemmatimonadaceae bacterium]|nr:hypothetical protein [Gemmatimonadaceae bacterium]
MVRSSGAVGAGRRGTSRLGCLVQLVVLGSIMYFGVYLGEDMLSYYRFRDAMKQEARFAGSRSDQQIRDRLKAFSDSVKLPSAAQEIRIVRDESKIHIWTDYDQEVKLPFNQSRVIHLRPSIEESF